MRKYKKLIVVLAAVLILFSAGFMYVADFYPATADALAALHSDAIVTVRQEADAVVFAPDAPQTGFIFYPGGKVEHLAYAPLMRALAQRGVLCVLVKMPCNLAVLDMNAAADIPARYPDIANWYIGGHSLGGSMAASYAAKNSSYYKGLALLAAYSTADLRESGLSVLSVYGSEDGVMNMEKYARYRENLPKNAAEYVIDGGCHAGFGSYGAQDGDGQMRISASEQIVQTLAQLEALGMFGQNEAENDRIDK